MSNNNYLIGNDYVINFKKLDVIEERFIQLIYEESFSRPFLWLKFHEDIICNSTITYTINTTSIVSTYLIKKENSYYFFELLKKLLRIGAILKIIYKKEFIIIHYYNEFITNYITKLNKWINISVGKILIDNNIVNELYFSSTYQNKEYLKEIELLAFSNYKKIICYTDIQEEINKEDFFNVFLTLDNIKDQKIDNIFRFNFIKNKILKTFKEFLV